jgi:ABC-2 type transport system permease protein
MNRTILSLWSLSVLMLGSATLAIGTFGSALARTQVLAAIFSGHVR